MSGLWRELFDFEKEDSTGDVLWFKMFELFLLAYSITWAWKWAFYIQTIHATVLPLGIANWIDISVFYHHGLSIVNAILITAGCLAGFFRIATRWAWLTAFIGLNLHYAARYSLGEIGHSSHFVGFGLFGMALGWFVGKSGLERRRLATGITIWFMGFGYASAGMSKLIGTGPTWVDGHHMWLWIGEKMVDVYGKYGDWGANWLQQAMLESRLLATLSLTFGLVVELAGIGLWWRRTRSWVALAAMAMHVGIMVSMRIDFSQFIVQLAVLCFPWWILFDRALANTSPKTRTAIENQVRRYA